MEPKLLLIFFFCVFLCFCNSQTYSSNPITTSPGLSPISTKLDYAVGTQPFMVQAGSCDIIDEIDIDIPKITVLEFFTNGMNIAVDHHGYVPGTYSPPSFTISLATGQFYTLGSMLDQNGLIHLSMDITQDFRINSSLNADLVIHYGDTQSGSCIEKVQTFTWDEFEDIQPLTAKVSQTDPVISFEVTFADPIFQSIYQHTLRTVNFLDLNDEVIFTVAMDYTNQITASEADLVKSTRMEIQFFSLSFFVDSSRLPSSCHEFTLDPSLKTFDPYIKGISLTNPYPSQNSQVTYNDVYLLDKNGQKFHFLSQTSPSPNTATLLPKTSTVTDFEISTSLDLVFTPIIGLLQCNPVKLTHQFIKECPLSSAKVPTEPFILTSDKSFGLNIQFDSSFDPLVYSPLLSSATRIIELTAPFRTFSFPTLTVEPGVDTPSTFELTDPFTDQDTYIGEFQYLDCTLFFPLRVSRSECSSILMKQANLSDTIDIFTFYVNGLQVYIPSPPMTQVQTNIALKETSSQQNPYLFGSPVTLVPLENLPDVFAFNLPENAPFYPETTYIILNLDFEVDGNSCPVSLVLETTKSCPVQSLSAGSINYPNTVGTIPVSVNTIDQGTKELLSETDFSFSLLQGSTQIQDFPSITSLDNIFIDLPSNISPGSYTLRFDSPLCRVSRNFTILPSSDAMAALDYDINQVDHTVKLTWQVPSSRIAQYSQSIPTLQYQFTLHPVTSDTQQSPPAIPTSLSGQAIPYAILSGSATFVGSSPNVEQYYNNVSIFPETAKYVTLTIPKLPSSIFKYGFYIIMVQLPASSSVSYAQPAENIAIWPFDSFEFPKVSCSNPCSSGTVCSEYTGTCVDDSNRNIGVPISDLKKSPLFDSQQTCTLECPLHFVKNTDCTQCLCIDANCYTYSRSYQIKLDVPSDWLSTNHRLVGPTMIKQYFQTALSNMLGLSQLPPRPTSSGYNGLYIGTPRPTLKSNRDNAKLDMDNYGGSEYLFVQFMNIAPTALLRTSAGMSTPIYHFDHLIITISMDPSSIPNPVATQVITRFTELTERLSQISRDSTPNSPLFPFSSNSHPYLPFVLNFANTDKRLQLIDYNLVYSSAKKTILTTQCQSVSDPNRFGTCPPTTATLGSSQFWSQCTQNSPSRLLSPVCFDYFGDIIPLSKKDSPTWCQPGWYDYPAITTLNTCSGSTAYSPIPAGESIQWQPRDNIEVGADSIEVTWSWPSNKNYNPSLTIDVLYYTSPTSYSRILATVLASRETVHVKIPENTTPDALTNAFIRLRCTQFAKHQTPPGSLFTLQVPSINKCNGVTCGSHQTCVPETGQCICSLGYNQSNDSNGCTLPCTGFCSEDFCHVSSPNTCDQCPDNTKLPPLCMTPNNCNNDLITGLNAQCSNHGFIPLNDNQCNFSDCQCVDYQYWTGKKCNVCLLIFDDPSKTKPEQDKERERIGKCVLNHTDIPKTIRDISGGGLQCGECACLAGYSGQYCEIELIRGDVTYILTDESSSPSPYQVQTLSVFDPNRIDDPNGSHFVTSEGRAVLEREMALSLGLDQDAITITKIVQAPASEFILQGNTPATIVPTQTNPTMKTIISYSISSKQTNLGDLTNAWNGLQQTFPELPVGNNEVNTEIGSVENIGNAQQPELQEPCNPDTHDCGCSDIDKISNGGLCPLKSKSSSSTGIIVGVVVAAVVVIALFITAIVVTKWAKKNQKCCFESKKGSRPSRRGDHLELTVDGGGYTASTNTTSDSNQSNKSKNSNKSAISGSATAVDLIEITDHGEDLPDGWSKHKHAVTGQVMYINQSQMKSQKHSPLEAAPVAGENGW